MLTKVNFVQNTIYACIDLYSGYMHIYYKIHSYICSVAIPTVMTLIHDMIFSQTSQKVAFRENMIMNVCASFALLQCYIATS